MKKFFGTSKDRNNKSSAIMVQLITSTLSSSSSSSSSSGIDPDSQHSASFDTTSQLFKKEVVGSDFDASWQSFNSFNDESSSSSSSQHIASEPEATSGKAVAIKPMSANNNRSNKGKEVRETPTKTIEKKKANKVKKGVSFYSRVKVHRVLSIYDYTNEEVDAVWMTEHEREHSVSCFRQDVRMLECGKEFVEEDPEHCARGLERQTRVARLESTIRIRDCVEAVWDEQSRQWTKNENDNERIAKIASQKTAESKKRARRLADLDATFVQNNIHTTSSTSNLEEITYE